MFGKGNKQESKTQSFSHIILTTAHEIPSKRYEIVDVIATHEYYIQKNFAEMKNELKQLADEVGADAVISMQMVNDHLVGGSGGRAIAYGTAVKFID